MTNWTKFLNKMSYFITTLLKQGTSSAVMAAVKMTQKTLFLGKTGKNVK